MNTMRMQETVPVNGRKGITGSTLKIIALVTMLIDHIAAIILDNLLMARGLAGLDQTDQTAIMEFLKVNGGIYYLDMAMRLIGRIGFPIFCFLLVEGFVHTKNIKKYALNLGIFALISEIPFNLAFMKNPWDLQYQNVFFTLFIGLLALISFQFISNQLKEKKILSILLHIIVLFVAMTVSTVMQTDYAGLGVAVIAVMYFLRKWKMPAGIAGCVTLCVMSMSELTAFFALIPIHLYNGKRGLRMKYVFYLFYPAHILILYLIALAMKIV